MRVQEGADGLSPSFADHLMFVRKLQAWSRREIVGAHQHRGGLNVHIKFVAVVLRPGLDATMQIIQQTVRQFYLLSLDVYC
jgi:hypothetical protein